MAASQTPTTTTMSTCTPETAKGTHVFKIAGYSLHKGLGIGNFIRSTTFAVGGYDWCIRYYPDGSDAEESKEYFSVCLELLTKDAEVRALFRFRLVFPHTSPPPPSKQVVFNSVTTPICGPRKFKKRSELEAALAFLRYHNNYIMIACDVIVVKETRVEDTTVQVQAPPSDLSDNLRELLEAKEGADVTFKVKGDVFHAHKIVLAMRSPVFKAQLYGSMRDKRRDITIEDMQPDVFQALLHFIYTDSLPSMDHLDGDKHKEMVKHLLVAADKYAMERMKAMCAAILRKSLDVETVATTFELADKHYCSELQDACVQFIKSSNRTDDIVASQAYKELKRSRPDVAIDMLERMLERVTKSRKI